MNQENDRETENELPADLSDARDAFASVGLVEEPMPPSRDLRSRLAATLRELPSKR